MEKNKRNKEWESIEKLVAILEKFITPNSRVEHNVKLPILGSPTKRKRQFDAVITLTSGSKIFTIVVEVQKRKSKPTIGMFHSWVTKMESVGATQLICVSEKGYPKSIFEEVQIKYGKKITLMTLKAFDDLLKPPNVNIDIDFTNLRNKHYEYVNPTPPQFEQAAQKYMPFEFLETDKVFLTSNTVEPFSLKEYVEQGIKIETNRPEFLEKFNRGELGNKGRIEMDLNESSGLYGVINGEKFLIIKWKLTIVVTITDIEHTKETKKYEYRHEIINDVLAWVSSTVFTMQGKSVQLDFIARIENGVPHYELKETLLPS